MYKQTSKLLLDDAFMYMCTRDKQQDLNRQIEIIEKNCDNKLQRHREIEKLKETFK